MKLSDGEKLILLMLAEIYRKLEINGEFDPEFIESAILADQSWGIGWKHVGIPFADKNTPAVVSEVLDILDMWTCIEAAVSQLSGQELNSLEQTARSRGLSLKFKGFDGNNEGEYLAATRFLIEDLDRYTSIKDRNLNSHFQFLDQYSRMLSVFSGFKSSLISGGLTFDQLVSIFEA